MDDTSKLLQSLLDPDEGKRVAAVSDLLYSIESVARVISLSLKGLAQLPTIKDDFEIVRELHAASGTVDNITTQIEAHWFALHLHLERSKQAQKETAKQRAAEHNEAVTLH